MYPDYDFSTLRAEHFSKKVKKKKKKKKKKMKKETICIYTHAFL